MIKAVIFDLDGTLVDTDPYWKEADFLFAKEYGFPLTEKFWNGLWGLGIKESAELFIKTYNLKETSDSFMAKRMKYLYKILLKKLKLMPYAQELIRKLKSRGYVLALATAGHPTDMAKKILDMLSVLDDFSYVISGLEVKRGKPAPDIYIAVLKEMNLKAHECMVIEDTVNGVRSGKAAGMRVIGVKNNDEVREKFKTIKTDFIFKDLNIPLEIFST